MINAAPPEDFNVKLKDEEVFEIDATSKFTTNIDGMPEFAN